MSTLDQVIKAIKRLSSSSSVPAEQAMERASSLRSVIPLERYAPSAIARSTLQLPAAPRGFSEAIDTYTPPLTAVLMRPSELLARTPPIDTPYDDEIVKQLMASMQEKGLKSLPYVRVNELPAPTLRELHPEGRHRMKGQQLLYGDDPVLMNWLQGDRFTAHPRYADSLEYQGPSELSPLELMRYPVKAGFVPNETPIKLDPLW